MITINRHVLDNGLRIVHSPDYSTQMVTVNILYNVGARNEVPEHTGLAHLFEHLMFGGSINIPDFDTPIQEAGGEDNAFTTNDITNYFITIPYQNVEVAFWLESDRMLSLAFTPKSLEVQRHVVIEEFKQSCLNQPYGDSAHLLRSLVYKVHPYQWPTIGKDISHIEQVDMDLVKQFFFGFYAPNNAILAVTGHISFEETLRLSEKWFSEIPSRNLSIRPLPKEPEQNEYRHMEVERNVPVGALYLAFPMCACMDKDYYAYDILSDILSNGKSSRLPQELMYKTPVFSSVDAFIQGSIDPGHFQIVGKTLPGISLEKAEDAVFKILSDLVDKSIDSLELEKVQNKFESAQIFGYTNHINLARNLAYYEILGDANLINQEVERYRSVTSEQLQKVAKMVFVKEKCSSLYYYPSNGGA